MNKRMKAIEKILTVCVGWLVCKVNEDRKNLIKFEKKDGLIFKQEEVLKTYEKWVEIYQNKQFISDYLIRNEYRNVAIYGLGRLGKQLYRELISSEVNVAYVVDKIYSLNNEFYMGARCYHPEDKLPATDLIIITVPGEAKEIGYQLKKKGIYMVKSINEVLFVID